MAPEIVQLRILKDALHPALFENLSENREESQIAEPLCTDGATLESISDAQNAQCTPYAPGTHKSTRENFGKPAKSFLFVKTLLQLD